jgi:hypothetical protein
MTNLAKVSLIALFFSSCATSYVVSHKHLYEADVVVKYDADGQRLNRKTSDTLEIVYWDYIELFDGSLIKKDGQVIAYHVKSYKFIEKKKVDL